MLTDPVVNTSYARTPIGWLHRAFRTLKAIFRAQRAAVQGRCRRDLYVKACPRRERCDHGGECLDATALAMTREPAARKHGALFEARFTAHAAHASKPQLFRTALAEAIREVLSRAGWRPNGRDLFEVDGAFAIVPMIGGSEFICRDRLILNGGARASRHPIGASGAGISAILRAALEAGGTKRGVASQCIDGGETIAIEVELVR
ncbi:hypothetical protein [Mesorhizobium sp. M1163]|uniref:hypothetical protein n=1 Tax=Mesorhizobium sp. M1163 TaxID=2957065 RepID=UPI003336FDC1